MSGENNFGVTNDVAPADSAPVEAVEGAEPLDSAAAPEAAAQAAITALEAKPNLTKSEVKRLNSLRLKVDGREFDETLPFDIPDTAEARDWMTKNLQMSKVSQKRMGEYAKLEGEAKQFIEQLRKDPESILRDPNLGIDLKKLAARVIEEEISNSQKSPEQLAMEKAQSELKKYKEERDREKQDSQKRESEALTKQAYEQYDVEMSRALEKSDLPKSPYVVKKMADYLHTALQHGVNLTAEEILPLVREEVQNDLKEMFQIMPEDVIEKIIGTDVLTKLRKKNIAKAKGLVPKPNMPLKSAVQDTGNKGSKQVEAKKQTFKDFFGV